MRMLGVRGGRRLRRTLSALSLTLVATLLAVLALTNEGDPVTEVTFNDGSVWVTNQREGLVGRINPQIQELDLGLEAPGSQFDVKQRGSSVFTDAQVAGETTVVPIDVARAAGGSSTTLPTGTRVAYNAGVLALFDPATGRAWVQSEDRLTSVDAKARGAVGKDVVAAAVGVDGTAHFVQQDGRVLTARFTSAGELEVREAGSLPRDLGSNVEVTAVGGTVVVLDVESGQLLTTSGGPIDLREADPTNVRLQAPSASADSVVVGTAQDVRRVDLDGQATTGLRDELGLEAPARGVPAPPVVVAGCVYAAWGDATPGAANYLRDCPGTADDDAQALGGEVQSGAELVFRVNRQVVVLNDTYSGDTWMVQQPGHKMVTNWDSINPQKQNNPTQKKITEKVERKDNRRPEATNDDQFSARLNKATILPVVAINDHDPDGDIITITKVEELPGGPGVQPKIISGGTQIQVHARGAQKGQAKLRYTVDDGNGGEDSADVLLKLLPEGATNRKPLLMPDREPRMSVARGRSSSLYLLADFYDPDGDDLVLTRAVSADGQVEYRPDGTIQFTDNAPDSSGGAKQIAYTIEDGHGGTYEGKLTVDPVGARTPPELVPDLKSGVAGTRALVQPLLNDHNPVGGKLHLQRVSVRGNRTGTTLTTDPANGTFTFTAAKAGAYYLDYRASTESGATASSFVRFDVTSPPKDSHAPVVVGDKAVLTPGSTTEVDLLLNDIDVDGDVLVVTEVLESSIPGVKVSVVDKRVAVISSSADLAGRTATVTYRVSDGVNTSDGTLTVTQRTTPQDSSPVANKDQVTAREGSVSTAAVLANDSDPDGGSLELTSVDPEDDGFDIWVAGNQLRFKAPGLKGAQPQEFRAIYGIKDADGRLADAELTVFVVPDSAQSNKPPAPAPIIERAVAGQPKIIQMDLSGADPDGDAVTFSRVISAPKRGRILETGAGWVKYEAYPNRPGTDFFQLEVRDKFGAIGVAAVRVGVVRQLETDQPPVALDDSIVVRPDRRVSAYVLANDADPDDDKLMIGDRLEAAKQLNATQQDGFIHLDVPPLAEGEASTTSTVTYQLLDEARQKDEALLRVEARDDAPFYAPVAQDDVVELADLAGRSAGETVEVEPLVNDLDVDGARGDLRLTGCRADAPRGCKVIDNKLRITLTPQDQVVVYDVADADEESDDTSGVVFVRGTSRVAPTVNSRVVPLTARADTPLPFDLAQTILTRQGRTPSLVPGTKPEAINGRVRAEAELAGRLTYIPPAGYVGPASVSLEVTDARDSSDEDSLPSIVTIPINVVPIRNVAPTVRGAWVTVAEDADIELDLAGLVRDTEPKFAPREMLYTVPRVTGPVTADLTGTLLTVRATGDQDGIGRVDFVVDDREGARTRATITVQVVASNRRLARIPTQQREALRGERVTVDIAEGAVNPYREENKPLRVLEGYTVEGGPESAVADYSVDGTRISFVPKASGVFTLRFMVADATGEPDREVVGRIRVLVADRPDAPTRPEVSSVEADSVVLSWRQPNDNGSPITRYLVRGSNGFSQICTATTCPLDGLTPGRTYTFQVAAENGKGVGGFSPASATVQPNRVPGIMRAPQVLPNPRNRDSQLMLRWARPANDGAPITQYVVSWNGNSRTFPAVTQATITGLENGTSYVFTIHAVNSKGSGTESPASAPETPFGRPRAPQKPVVLPSEWGDEPSVGIAWEPSVDNGDPIQEYVVTCDQCRPRRYRVEGTSKTFTAADGIRNGVTYTFRVAAINRAGASEEGPDGSGRPYRPAGPVQQLRYRGSPEDRTAVVSFREADLGGLPLKHYVLRAGGNTVLLTRAMPDGVRVEFPANGEHEVSVQPVTQQSGNSEVLGEETAIGGVLTWGRPGPPSGGGRTSNNHYLVRYEAEEGIANGKEVTGLQYRMAGSWIDVGRGTGDVKVDVRYGGEQKCLSFRTVSAATGNRRFSEAKELCGTSKMRAVRVTKGKQWKGDAGVACDAADQTLPCTLRSARVSGNGFPKGGRPPVQLTATTSAGTCPTRVRADSDGRIDFSTVDVCWFADETWDVVATVHGVSSPRPEPPSVSNANQSTGAQLQRARLEREAR